MTLLEKLQRTGIRRLGSSKNGFRYVTREGRRVGAREAARIAKLGIPPAWTEVRIDPSSHAGLQAVGKDKAGRWQYRYQPAHGREP